VLAFHDGKKLSGIIDWDAHSGKRLDFEAQVHGAGAMDVTPDGTTVLLPQVDKSVGVFELTSGKKVGVLAGHTARVTAIAVSPDGAVAVTGSADQTLRLWDLATAKERRRFTGQGTVLSAMFMPDGLTVLTSSADGAIRRVDLFDATVKPRIIFEAPASAIHRARCLPMAGLSQCRRRAERSSLWTPTPARRCTSGSSPAAPMLPSPRTAVTSLTGNADGTGVHSAAAAA